MGIAYFPQIKFTFYVLAQKVGAIAAGGSIHDEILYEPSINFKHSRLPAFLGLLFLVFSPKQKLTIN